MILTTGGKLENLRLIYFTHETSYNTMPLYQHFTRCEN